MVKRSRKKAALGFGIRGLGFGASLTSGRLPTSGAFGILGTVINVLVALVFGTLIGNGVRAFASSVPFLNREPIPTVLGGVAAFSSGGIAGASGYVVASGFLGGQQGSSQA